MKLRRPCSNCPWRVDAPRHHWDLQHFVDIAHTCRDDGVHQMLCHKASELPVEQRNKLVCQGWVRVEGFGAVGVRIAHMQGNVTTAEIEDTAGPELFKSFDLMLRANRVAIPPRNRATPPVKPPRRIRAR